MNLSVRTSVDYFYERFSFYDPNVVNNKEVEHETDIQEKKQKESQNQAQNGKDKVEGVSSSESMAYSNSGSDTEVTSCSKECKESYAYLKKLYDEQREQLCDASIEIQAYTLALKKVEAQLVCHQKNQLAYDEKNRFMKIDLDDKTNVLTYHKKLLAEAVKEKEELKTKLENFQSSSKCLSKLLNTHMSTKDKSGLGYRDQIHEGLLSYENEVLESVFDNRPSDVEDSPVYDRFAKVEGMHAVPPPMTGIYMPPKYNFGIAVTKPKAVSEPKVWSDAPIIEEYEQTVMMNMETVKEQNRCSPSPKADKRDWNGLMSKKLGLGYGFTKKACFGTGHGENRPVWNNVQRLNHQNKFVPTIVLTKTGRFPVNAARQNLSSQTTATSTARKVNTARPVVNEIRPRNNFYKSHSPIRRPFNRTTALKANFTNHKVNTMGIVDSGCSRHMTGNKAYLVEYQDYNGGPVVFEGSKGQINGKDSECLVLSPDFKLPDENQVLIRVPKQNNMYSFNLENIVPTRGLACLIRKATIDESRSYDGSEKDL
ncbi:hypothetical protein Tco_0882381 [Tanacetum coccineum]